MPATTGVFKASVKGFSGIEKNLQKLLRSRMMPKVKEAVLSSAEDVAFVAREMAPELTGKLVSAIEMKDQRHNIGWSREAVIWIRPSVYNTPYHRRVGDYAYDVHQSVKPGGVKGLGPKSQSKANRTNNYDGIGVGGLFMNRALEYSIPLVYSKIKTAVDSFLRSL